VVDFLALMGDEQEQDLFFGVLVVDGVVPGRFHWYVLGLDDAPLVRGTAECEDDPACAETRINSLKQAVANEIGVAPSQIKLVDKDVKSLIIPA